MKGADFERLDETLSEALARAAHATQYFVALGERWDWSGESKARLMPKVPAAQVELVQRLREATGVHIIVYHRRPAAEDSGCGAAVRRRNSLGAPAWHACGHGACERALRQEEFLGAPRSRAPLPRSAHLRLLASGAAHWPAIDPLQCATFEYNSQGWGAYFQELGERGSLAEYHHGEGVFVHRGRLFARVLSGASLSIAGGTALTASALVENVVTVAGKETVQLYRHDTVSEAVPRRLELLAYKQVELAPGESVEVSFAITPDMLAQYGVDLDEGRRPRPDPYPVYLFIVRHAGEAEAALFSADQSSNSC